jgi:SAM-dependent methyltransferase
MSGFDPAWLDLREPVDHAAVDPGLLVRLRDRFVVRDAITVCDLGCGTGSMLRLLADLLPPVQRWTLIDADPALIAAGRARLAAWADRIETDGDCVILTRGDRRVMVGWRLVDLAMTPAPWGEPPDLVTAAALFDLAGADWIDRFVSALAATGGAFLATSIYDGRAAFDPPDPRDLIVRDLFHRDMGRDKGLGPALGPGAADYLRRALARAGLSVAEGDGPWELAPGAPLAASLLDGWVAAVSAGGGMAPADLADWRAGHAVSRITLGHADLFAWR